MLPKLFLFLLLTPSLNVGSVSAEDTPIKHRIMFAEYGKGPNRLVEVSADGKLVWQHRFPSISVIFQVLANGNIVYAYGGKPTGVQEITRDGKIVWNYESRCPQVLGCERLANGNTLVAEQGPCQVVEVNARGQVVKIVKLTTAEKNHHLQVRNVHRLGNGHVLAGHEGEGAVREVDAAGKVIWEFTHVDNAPEGLRLPNGNTLIACGTQRRIIEVTPEKQVVGVRSEGRSGVEPGFPACKSSRTATWLSATFFEARKVRERMPSRLPAPNKSSGSSPTMK